MNHKRNEIPARQQNNIFSITRNSVRPSSQNSKIPGTLNISKSDISEIKQGQTKIISELSKLSVSINNLVKEIHTLVEKNNGGGHNSKKSSFNESLSSNFSKNSSGTAYYRRRDLSKKNGKNEESSEQNKEKGGRKTIQIVQNYDKCIKIKKR